MVRLANRKVLVALVVAAAVCTAFYVKVRIDDSVLSAAQILMESPAVTTSVIGPGFEPSIQSWAYCRVRTSPEAPVVFSEIFDRGTPAAKTYALFALMELDLEAHGKLIGELGDEAAISQCFGCFYSERQRPGDVLLRLSNSPESFDCNIAAPSRSISLWVDMEKPAFDKLRSATLGRIDWWLWQRRIRRMANEQAAKPDV